MLKSGVRHCMLVDKIHTVVSFEHIKWLEKYITFNTQKRNMAKNEFEEDFREILKNAIYGKTMEKVRNRLKSDLIKKDETDKIIKQQSNLTFKGIHKSYENCDSYKLQ